MGFFSGKTKTITTGGKFIRGVKEEGERARGLVGQAITAAEQPFEAYSAEQRFAGFTPEELAAQDLQRGLAGLSPEAAQERLADLTALRQAATAGIRAEDIAAQRQMLEGTADASKMAARRGLQEALRDIGVGAGGAGVGALTGARADILRGGAAGEYAQTLAGIESGLQQQAVTGARQSLADRLSSGADLLGEEAGMARDIYGQQLAQSQLLGDVGLRQRELEQQRRDFSYGEAMREEEAPFLSAQRATQAIGGLTGLMTPQQTTTIKKKSGFQKLAGVGMIAAGAMSGNPMLMAQGASTAAKTGGGIASLAMGGAPTNYRQVLGQYKQRMTKDGDFQLPDGTVISGDTGFERGIKDPKTGKDIADTPVKVEKQKKGLSDKDRQNLISKGTSMLEDEIIDMGSAELTPAQKVARQRYMQQYQAGGGIAALAEGGDVSILDRIVEGAKNAYQKFKDIPSEDKIKYGLALLATEPASPYESSATTFARGLLGGQQLISAEDKQERELAIEEMKARATANAYASFGNPLPLSDLKDIKKSIFGIENISNIIPQVAEIDTYIKNLGASQRYQDPDERKEVERQAATKIYTDLKEIRNNPQQMQAYLSELNIGPQLAGQTNLPVIQDDIEASNIIEQYRK